MKNEFYTLGSFEFPADAVVIKGKLEAEGIAVFLKDENTINSDPLISAALGGVKLQVYSSDKERAKEIFDEVRNYATDEFGNPVVCPNCKATKSEIYYSRSTVFYKLFPFFEPRKYQCMKCNFITRPQK
ncbi:hypothetical protein Murru_1068 [Allomuricauda ruestringensis DSM 13258]|uniref:Uncharacterized protein n=1 Tax=Allomuricauda ruestringensis (strain DSM 13258 / CIP 107369 / LMG 19739 / B1) TaxID=886377 RepID=G2PMK5_ALLRU|nr:DUF2007 domain-containing protein [Allomuricauda ruestringensis]AEM70112.1 hypothetical protein Murru_1068 [Allomuricauda ruestringensis DSM 13258]